MYINKYIYVFGAPSINFVLIRVICNALNFVRACCNISQRGLVDGIVGLSRLNIA